ncbi:MAG: type II secretion system protein [Chromatiales bacterium]|jgi:prepilin-type N-terminal cleavage/methylation domain-containing protein
MRLKSVGFTLIEMVITILLVGIVAGVLAPIYRQAGEMYSATHARSELTARGRLALERLSRELREADPTQIQASADRLRFRRLEKLLAIDLQGGIPQRHYRACQEVSVNRLGDSLDWDRDDDGSSDAILMDGVEAVSFSYSPGATQRSGVVGIDLRLNMADESIRLFREVHLRNIQGKVSCP